MTEFFRKYPVWSVLVFSLLALLPVMALRDFSPSNELRYLSIADEALRDGHLFAFTNHGMAYADKPPLYFWLIMLCRSVAGCHSMLLLTLLFSFLPACVIVLVMDRWTLGGASPLTRAASAMMMMSSALFLGMSVFLRMDMLMCMFIVLALYAFSQGRRWAFALCCFMALFTKGPLGVLIPIVSVVSCLVAGHRPRAIGRWLGWRFWTVMAVGCLIWFTGVYLDGGREYLENLLVHQTVDRAVNSFAHKAPFWQYFILIWGVVAPWCLLTVPTLLQECAGRLKQGCSHADSDDAEAKMICLWTAVSAFILMSCFSSKLAIYLAPIFPFLNYLFPLAISEREWGGWRKAVLAVPCAALALLGSASVVAVIFYDRIPALERFSFVHSLPILLYGVILACGSIAAMRLLRDGWQKSVLILGASLILLLTFCAMKSRQINDFVGYRNICAAVPEGTEVYTLKVRRAENMDVYLGRDIHILPPEEELTEGSIPDDCALITGKNFRSPVLSDRTPVTFGEYTLWLLKQSE